MEFTLQDTFRPLLSMVDVSRYDTYLLVCRKKKKKKAKEVLETVEKVEERGREREKEAEEGVAQPKTKAEKAYQKVQEKRVCPI